MELPLTGWHGHAEPFALNRTTVPAAGIERARIGTPPLLSMLALEAALDVFDGVELADVRAKSLALTDLVIDYADATCRDVEVVTPRDPARRGSPGGAAACRDAYEVDAGADRPRRGRRLPRAGHAAAGLRAALPVLHRGVGRDGAAARGARERGVDGPAFARRRRAVT